MSKVLNATCAAGVVTAASFPVTGATILSQGIRASTGLLVMDDDKKTYVTSNAADIHDAIVSLNTIIGQIVTILSAHDAVTTAPGASAAAIAALTALKTTFNATKDTLK